MVDYHRATYMIQVLWLADPRPRKYVWMKEVSWLAERGDVTLYGSLVGGDGRSFSGLIGKLDREWEESVLPPARQPSWKYAHEPYTMRKPSSICSTVLIEYKQLKGEGLGT